MNELPDVYLPEAEVLAQLAEEVAELAQAALKLRRALDGTNPTPCFLVKGLSDPEADDFCSYWKLKKGGGIP